MSTALTREALDEKGKLIVIAFVKADGTTHLKLVLQNTLIGQFSVSGHGGVTDSRVTESLSLTFAKITFEMQATSPDITHSQVYQLSQQATWELIPDHKADIGAKLFRSVPGASSFLDNKSHVTRQKCVG